MRLIVATILSLWSVLVTAEGDSGAGKALYSACAACHGPAAQGVSALNAPRLSHLEGVYIAAQLQKFRSGVRGGAGSSAPAMQMAGMAATLPGEPGIEDVTSYIATLSGERSPAVIEGDIELGGDYYNQYCGACHGAAADGNPALNSPRLAGGDDWYLLAQLQAFRAGQRGSHADDRTGRQMRAMAGVLPNEQAMKDVVAFIRSLEP